VSARPLATAWLTAALLTGPLQPQRKQRPPDLEIVRIASVRQEGRISYAGAWKLTAEKPVTGLVLRLHFFESRGALLSMQKIQLEEATLAPGEEKAFEVQGSDVPRAVNFRVSATDAGGRDLTVSRAGPYPLD